MVASIKSAMRDEMLGAPCNTAIRIQKQLVEMT